MPSHPNRRAPSSRVYSSAPNDRQVRFPSPRGSMNPTKPTLPASRTRQQTLTQIDFVTKYLPQADDVDLSYIEQEASPKRKRRRTLPSKDATTAVEEDGPSKRKRRKTLPAQDTAPVLEEDSSPERKRRRALRVNNTPSVVETRTSGRRKVKQEPESEITATSITRGNQSIDTRTRKNPSRGELIPPRTPVTARKVEIPSSQSPADTPLSTQRTSSLRTAVRSPLKARSTNVRVPLNARLNGGKSTGWHPRLEVKSSVSWENDDTQLLTASPFLSIAGRREYDFRRSDSSDGSHIRQEKNTKSEGTLQDPIRTGETFNRAMPTPQSDQFSKTEIRDSDDEEEEEEGEEVSSLHEMTNTTQPIENEPTELPRSIQPTSNQSSPPKAVPTSNTDVPFLSPSSSNRELGPNNTNNDALTDGDKPSPIHQQLPPISSAEAASAQLSSDLYRQTQPQPQSPHEGYTSLNYPPTPTSRLLDSQSQFGFICREYTPSPPPLSPIAPALPVSYERNVLHQHSQDSRSPSPSTSNHPRTSQVSTQSPVSTRTIHQTTYPGPPHEQPHYQPSQFSTQSQSPLKGPDRNALPAIQPRIQRRPSFESRSSPQEMHTEFTLPALPRQRAHVEKEQEYEHEQVRSSTCSADTDADFFPPETFLQSSPMLAPSLPSSPSLSRTHLHYVSQGQDEYEDEDQREHATAEVGVEGEGHGWDGRIKTTSQFLPESMLEGESQNFGLCLPPRFSSELLEQE